MADPLSVSASIVGLVVPALHGTRILLDDLKELRDAPKAIKRLTDELHSVDLALESLRNVKDTEWMSLGTIIAKQSETTISTCTQACNLFRADLQKWTKHSEDGKLAFLDRANIGFFKKEQIKAISEQLQNCKLTITSVVSIATLYSSVRHTKVTEEIKSIISTKHIEVKDAVTTADKQLVVLENNLKELDLSDDEEAAGTADSKAGTLLQLEETRKALKASRELLDELLSKSQEDAVARAAGGTGISSNTATFGNNVGGFQANVINGSVSGLSFGRK